ncbi:MAG: hypothetical protein WCJ58_08535, partial [bacterium]
SNFSIEKKLGKMGIGTYRFISLSGIIFDGAFGKESHLNYFTKAGSPFIKYHIGGHGTESVGKTHELIKKGFDGVIHLKPFGCIPEVNAMPILQEMSRKYKFPILYFSLDSLTSEVGIQTRLEAFYDMLIMKKKKSKLNSNN